jgi:DNA repair photolyase
MSSHVSETERLGKKTLVNDDEFNNQRNDTGTREWAEINANIQKGCSNNCLYCYAMSNALRFGQIQTHEQWGQETIDWKAVNKKWPKRDGVIMFPTAHDITPSNLDAAITALRNMLAPGNKVLVVSKPRLDCIVALCKELKDYSAQLLFRFTIGSTDWRTCAFWEPGAPEPRDRIAALNYAYGKGFRTSVSMEPLLAGIGMAIQTYGTVVPFVTDDIWIGKMNKIRSRVDTSIADNLIAVESLEQLQRNEEILRLVGILGKEKNVRWKDSIQAVIHRYTTGPSEAVS